jgi:hypothetical protein
LVVTNQHGQLHAFKIGLDGRVGHSEPLSGRLSAPWSGWHTISAPGDLVVNLIVVPDQDDRLHAFVLE